MPFIKCSLYFLGVFVGAVFMACFFNLDSFKFESDDLKLSLKCPLGVYITFSMTHSVQLAKVEEDVFAHAGKLWFWEERTKTHGAGLASNIPDKGRVFMKDSWITTQGTGKYLTDIFYRVGTSLLGKNEVFYSNTTLKLYEMLPKKRLHILASKDSFL